MTKTKKPPCYCHAYSFPHTFHGGVCNSCEHGKDWRGVYNAYYQELGEWCEKCAYEEGFRGDPSESSSAWERNIKASWLK